MTPELKARYLELDRAIGSFVELLTDVSDDAKAALDKVDAASEALLKALDRASGEQTNNNKENEN